MLFQFISSSHTIRCLLRMLCWHLAPLSRHLCRHCKLQYLLAMYYGNYQSCYYAINYSLKNANHSKLDIEIGNKYVIEVCVSYINDNTDLTFILLKWQLLFKKTTSKWKNPLPPRCVSINLPRWAREHCN